MFSGRSDRQRKGHPKTECDALIGDDVPIETEAVISSGITIGDRAVVGARAIVTRDIAPDPIVAGNPARLVRFRFEKETIEKLSGLRRWDWDDTELKKKQYQELLNNSANLFSSSPNVDAIGGRLHELSANPLHKSEKWIMTDSVQDQFITRASPSFPPWIAMESVPVEACPICGSAHRSILHEGLSDNVFYCAPGKWTSWRCSACGSAYLNPCPSLASIHLAYETYYTHREPPPKNDYTALGSSRKVRRRLVNGYTNWRYSTRERPASLIGVFVLWVAWPLKITLDREYRHLSRLPALGGALLDVGCGDGSFLRIAQSCGWSVTGVDTDPKAIANCRSQGWNVLQGGVEQFDGKDGLFDIITMSHVIEHVHDPVVVLKTCHRLLKPDGRLWLETPNIDSLGHRQYGRNWRGLEPPRHLVLFNGGALTLALATAGFARVESRAGANPLLWISIASEALKQGRPIGSEIRLSRWQRWLIRMNVLLQTMTPSRREFLTVVALKE